VDRTIRFVPDFFISKNEITAGEYLEFINYLETHIPGSAEKYLPRKAASSGFYWKKTNGRYQTISDGISVRLACFGNFMERCQGLL
jgi:formylglycine-generating enzyme required for sulfatase activity